MSAHPHAGGLDVGRPARPVAAARTFARRVRVVLSAVAAAVLGAAPHVLHHAGPLAGAALLGGATGSLAFGALGVVAAIPILRRVRRRTGSSRLPVALLAAFAFVFAASTALTRSVLSGADRTAERPSAGAPARPAGMSLSEHESHHR
jgi:hypothetical protein